MLKQTESKNPYQRVQDEMQALLNFLQAAGMNNNDYYEKTANRVEITRNAGGVFYTYAVRSGGPREVQAGLRGFDI